MIPEKECPQAGQTNVYVSNPQLSITGSSDLRNGTSAVQLGHSANPASPDNGNFETFSTRGQLPCVLARSTPSARQGAAGGDEACHLRARGRKRRWSSGNSASKPWRKLLDGGTGNPPGAPDNVRTSARQRKSSAEARLIGNFGQRCAFTSRGQAPFARSFLFDPQTM